MVKLMVKTTPLNDDTHKCLKVAQTILYEKYNVQIPIPDIIAAVIYDADQIVKIVLEKRNVENIENVDIGKIIDISTLEKSLEKRDIENVDIQKDKPPEEEVYAGK